MLNFQVTQSATKFGGITVSEVIVKNSDDNIIGLISTVNNRTLFLPSKRCYSLNSTELAEILQYIDSVDNRVGKV